MKMQFNWSFGHWSFGHSRVERILLRVGCSALIAVIIGLLSPALALAQNPYGGPTTGPPNAGQNSFYNGGAPAAKFQQRRPQSPQRQASLERSRASDHEPGASRELFEPGEVLAVVGDQYILAADVLPHVNQVLEQYRGKVPEEEINKQRRVLIAQLTAAHIDVKILYLAFLRKVPADKLKDVLKKVDAEFDRKLDEMRREIERKNKDDYSDLLHKESQVGRLVIQMKEQGLWSPGELDLMLRRYGGSLAQEKRYFEESTLGGEMVYQSMNADPPVSYDEMLK